MGGWCLLVDLGDDRVVVGTSDGRALRIVASDARSPVQAKAQVSSLDRSEVCDGPTVEQLDGGALPFATGRRPAQNEVRALLEDAARRAGETESGTAPGGLWITGPAATGGRDQSVLLAAARKIGIEEVHIVPEPEALAASMSAARAEGVARVAVCALGSERRSIAVVDVSSVQPRCLAASVQDGEPVDEQRLRQTVEALADLARAHGPTGAVVLAGAVAATETMSELVVAALGIRPEPGDPTTAGVRGLAALASRQAQSAENEMVAVSITGDAIAIGPSTELEPVSLPAEATAPEESTQTELEPLDDDVQFTVFRPRSVRPDRWYTALVFAHRTDPLVDDTVGMIDPLEEVRARAAERLGERAEGYASASQESVEGIPHGAMLTFVPQVEGVCFNPERRTISWQEPVHMEEFRLLASGAMAPGVRRGALSVYRGAILIADINLSIRVGDAELPALPSHARPYRKIFLSYSHSDIAIAEQVEEVYEALGDTPLRDQRILRSGEVWNAQIEQMIRDAEIFQLFWSTNSMRSAWVTKEWRYALNLGRPHFVRPTYWEDPLPSAPEEGLPPAELSCLHFSSLKLGRDPAPAGAHPTFPGAPPAFEPEARGREDSGDATFVTAPGPGAEAAPSLKHLARATRATPTAAAEAAASAPPEMAAAAEPVALDPAAVPLEPVATTDGTGGASRHPSRKMVMARPLAILGLVALASSLVFAGMTRVTPHAARAPAVEMLTGLSRAAPPTAEGPAASSCASCRPLGAGCPRCTVASGVGTRDLGPIESSDGLLIWKSDTRAPLTILLEGRAVSTGAMSGNVPLPRHSYADLAVVTDGAWSVVIH